MAGAPTGKLPAVTDREPGVVVGFGGVGVEEFILGWFCRWVGCEL